MCCVIQERIWKFYYKVIKFYRQLKKIEINERKKSASPVHYKLCEVPIKMNTSSTSTNTVSYLLSKIIIIIVIPNNNPAKSNSKAFYRHAKWVT